MINPFERMGFFMRYSVTKLQFPYLRHNFGKAKNQRGVLQKKNFCRENYFSQISKDFDALQNASQKNIFVAMYS